MKQTMKRLLRRAGLRRESVAAGRMFAERNVLAGLSRPRKARPGGRILCYHSVGQPQTGTNDVSPALFRQHIEFAIERGYRFVPAKDIALTGGAPNDLALTFDDAWTSVADQAAPIMREHQIPWSLFVVSDWSEHRPVWTRDSILDWRALEKLKAEGVDIGCHSATHADFGKLDPMWLSAELEGSRDLIEARLGFCPTSFAIPLGQSMNWTSAAESAARSAGYEIIYAQAVDTRPPQTVARNFVTKFDRAPIFSALLNGAFDQWEEWV